MSHKNNWRIPLLLGFLALLGGYASLVQVMPLFTESQAVQKNIALLIAGVLSPLSAWFLHSYISEKAKKDEELEVYGKRLTNIENCVTAMSSDKELGATKQQLIETITQAGNGLVEVTKEQGQTMATTLGEALLKNEEALSKLSGERGDLLKGIESATIGKIAHFISDQYRESQNSKKIIKPDKRTIQARTFQMLIWASYYDYCKTMLQPSLEKIGIRLNPVHYWNGQVDDFLPTFAYRVQGLYNESHPYMDAIIFDIEKLEDLEPPRYLRDKYLEYKNASQRDKGEVSFWESVFISASRSHFGVEKCDLNCAVGDRNKRSCIKDKEKCNTSLENKENRPRGPFILPLQWLADIEKEGGVHITEDIITEIATATLFGLKLEYENLTGDQLDTCISLLCKDRSFRSEHKEFCNERCSFIPGNCDVNKKPLVYKRNLIKTFLDETKKRQLIVHPRLVPTSGDEQFKKKYDQEQYFNDWPINEMQSLYGIPLRYGLNAFNRYGERNNIFGNSEMKNIQKHYFMDWYYASMLPIAILQHGENYFKEELTPEQVELWVPHTKQLTIVSTITEIPPFLQEDPFPKIFWGGGEWICHKPVKGNTPGVWWHPLTKLKEIEIRGAFWLESFAITSDIILHAVNAKADENAWAKLRKVIIDTMDEDDLSKVKNQIIEATGLNLLTLKNDIAGLWTTIGVYVLKLFFEELKINDALESNIYFSNYCPSRPVNMAVLNNLKSFPSTSHEDPIDFRECKSSTYLKWLFAGSSDVDALAGEKEWIKNTPLRRKPLWITAKSWESRFNEIKNRKDEKAKI